MGDKITIDIELGNVKAVTAALNELAAAADRAREAVDKLFGVPAPMIADVCVSAPHDVERSIADMEAEFAKGARKSDHRFKI